MTSVVPIDNDPAELDADAIVVGVYASGGPDGADSATGSIELAPGAERLDEVFGNQLATAFGLLGATGAVGEVTKVATLGRLPAGVVAAVGLGEAERCTTETLRRAAGAATRALAGSAHVALALPLSPPAPGPGAQGDASGAAGAGSDAPGDVAGAAAADRAGAAAEGALLGGYRFTGYKTRSDPHRREPVRTASVVVADRDDPAVTAALDRATAVARAVNQVRDWVNTAPNELRPPQFADAVAEAARTASLDVEVLDETALREAGYGGILAVGGGSGAPPRLVRIAYRPAGTESRHVALVGKGITFDTGGVSIKPANGMWEMKTDMAGAAAVGGVMLAVAALQPSVAVTGYLPMAENMPSGSAYRPGDVVTMYSGKRAEVLNTDAEGRMILADAIARACEDDPDYLLETSTLTGGQITALGKRVAGLMGTEELCERVQRAGEAVGELCWPMPLPEDVRKSMESEIADVAQIASGMDRGGHMLQGAVFLSAFVAEGVPWAHLDIAGPANHSGEPYGYVPKGGTGFPVRTLLRVVEDVAAEG